ncbi:MAG: hypothetical protein E7175_04425 [Erysipelotrichaceae bacterium]|nr:hypothetical protein [Erysipelotrichaceae bacterium]
MDNLKSLFDKKEYDLVIKLTRSSSDVDDLFYCLSAYLSLNKIDDALTLIKEKKDVLKTRLPMLMRTHIELLCLAQKFDEAYDTIKEYENMPYFSQEGEETLKSLPHIVREYERNFYKPHDISEDDLIKFLMSKDSNTVVGALDALRDKDITPYLIYINKILIDFPKQSIRSFALLLLVQKELNKVVKFNHMGKIIEVNPKELKAPFVDQEFADLSNKLVEVYKDSSLSMNALQILSTYLIYIYPEEVDYNDSKLIESLRIVTSEYLKQHYVSEHSVECEELVNDINHALEDF